MFSALWPTKLKEKTSRRIIVIIRSKLLVPILYPGETAEATVLQSHKIEVCISFPFDLLVH